MNINEIFDKINTKLLAEMKRVGSNIPYIPKDRKYVDAASIYGWTNGFWAGMLWQMYHATGNEEYKSIAEISENRLDAALDGFENIDHDAGFLWLHTAGANYRLTGSDRSKRRVLHAATTLAGRYNPDLKMIRAWNEKWMKGFDTAGGAIIDTVMNLPLLYLATEITGDPRFKRIGMLHADTMLEYMLRPDGSSNHQIVFDIETNEYITNPGGQGYESGSSWSRGQSWVIYGYALSYRHTGEVRYLDAAKRCAHYFMANASLTDYVPLLDFRAPQEPVYYDTTAAAIAACGMLEIAEHVGEFEKQMYVENAKRMLAALDKKWCDYDANTDGILDGGSTKYHTENHHERIIYGDYFYVEAILRLLGKDFLIW